MTKAPLDSELLEVRISLIIVLTIALPLGPLLQSLATGFFYSETITLYEAVFGDSIANFSASDPYTSVTIFAYLAIAVLAAASLRREDRYVDLFAKVFVASFIGICALDIFLWGTAETAYEFGPTLAANLVGSALLGLLSFVIVVFCQRASMSRRVIGIPLESILATTITVLFCGTFLSVFFVFLIPLSVPFEARLEAPASSYFSPDMGASEGARFKGLFPAAPYTKEIDAKLNNSVVSWSRDEDDPRNKFRADVYLYSDCAFQDPDSVPRQPSLSFSEIDNIRIAVEKGLSDVQVKSESNGWIVSTPGAIGTFWMPQPDASEEHLRSQNTFLSTDGAVEFRSNDPLEIRVTGFVINSESEADNYQKSPNEISMQIGAVERQLSFKPSDRRLTGRALLCQPIQKIDDISVLMSLTLVIRVFPANQDRVLFNRFEHFVSLRGDWMDVDLVDRDLTAFDNVSLGRAGFMGISSGLRELSVQGRPVLDPTDSSVLWVRGKIDVRSEDASTLFLEGTAEMMWVDERRLNPTRWELLSSDERMWALGGLGTFVLSVLAWLVPFVRRHWLGAVAENRAA